MNFEGQWGLSARVLGLLAITAVLAACGGSAESSGSADAAVTTSVASASPSVSGSPAATVLANTNSSSQPTAAAPTPEDFGAQCDGSTDDTTALTNWAESVQPYGALAMRTGEICIFNPGLGTYGLDFKNLSHFTLYGNGSIKAKAAAATSGNSLMMHFQTDHDIVIKDLTIDGNLANRTGTASYGGDNVFIEDGSARILFDNVHSINAPKDDWDITPDGAPTVQATYPTDITLQDSWGNGAYRNGLSAIGSVRLIITGGQYNNTSGTAPQTGIDIEPDSQQVYENTYTLIDGVDTSFNAGGGIQITVSSGSTYNSHIRIANWSAQGNAAYALNAPAVSDLEVDGAFISNVNAGTTGYGIINIPSGNGQTDISLINLNFATISGTTEAALIYVNNPNDRVSIDGVHVDTTTVPILVASTTVTALNIDAVNFNGAGGDAQAIVMAGGSDSVLQNISVDSSTDLKPAVSP
jgi:hypothetical protein